MLENTRSIPNIVGLAFLIAGIVMFFFPPKKINFLYGYRTKNSMRNIDRWNFAQRLSSKLLILFGILLLLTESAGVIFDIDESLNNIIGLVESILLTIFLFVKTEFDLKNKFGTTL